MHCTMLSTIVLALLSFTLLILLCPVITILFRRFGYQLSFRPYRLSSSSYTIGLDALTISLFSIAPPAAIITAYGYTYTDDEGLVRCDITIINLKPFAAPWLTLTIGDLSVRVFTSERTPRWIRQLRDDIFYSILNGETIRLQHLKTRVHFSRPSGSMNRFIDRVLNSASPQPDRNLCPQLSFTSSQWHIINTRQEMYRFGQLDLTSQRDWDNNSGTVSLVSNDSRWSSIPEQAHPEASKIRKFFQGLRPFRPSNPVEIYVLKCTVDFDFFRLRDAKLLRHLYQRLNKIYPGLFQGIIFDHLLAKLSSHLGSQEEI